MENDRNILITGGTGKVGGVIVQKALQDGHNVYIGTRNKIGARKLFQHDNAHVFELDLQGNIDLTPILDERIDMVIHCARSLDSLGINDNLYVDDKNWETEWKMGISAPYEITRQLRKAGSLHDAIFISSMYGVVAPTPSLYENFEKSSPVQYGVVKAAQIQLTKELAVRLAPIRVNCISYGGFEGRTDENFKARYGSLNPMGRMLGPQDVFAPVKMLLDDIEIAITGQNIQVDGGWTIW